MFQLGIDVVSALFIGYVFGVLWGVCATLTACLFPKEVRLFLTSPVRLIGRMRRWLATRGERRRSLERARHNALLIVCGGTLTAPRKR